MFISCKHGVPEDCVPRWMFSMEGEIIKRCNDIGFTTHLAWGNLQNEDDAYGSCQVLTLTFFKKEKNAWHSMTIRVKHEHGAQKKITELVNMWRRENVSFPAMAESLTTMYKL